MGVTQYIGARYVPIFADPAQWDKTRTYEPLTIVLHEGNSFTSKQFVPTGIELDNEEFWAETGNYNAQIESYRREVLDFKADATEEIEALRTETDAKIEDLENDVTEQLEEFEKFQKFETSKYMVPFKRFAPQGTNLKSTGAAQDILVFNMCRTDYMMVGIANNDESVHIEIYSIPSMRLIYSGDTDLLYHSIKGVFLNGAVYAYNNVTKNLIKINVDDVYNPVFSVQATLPADAPTNSYNPGVVMHYEGNQIVLSDGVDNFIHDVLTLEYIGRGPTFTDVFMVNGGCSDDKYYYLIGNFPNTIFVIDKTTGETLRKIPIGQKTLHFVYGEAEGIAIKDDVIYTCGDCIRENSKLIVNVVKYDLKTNEPFYGYPLYESWTDATVYVNMNADLNVNDTTNIGTANNPFKYIEDATISCPPNIDLNVVIIGEYTSQINVPSNVNSIAGADANAKTNGLVVSRRNDLQICGPLSIKRSVGLFGTYTCAIRVYNGNIVLTNDVTFEAGETSVVDENQWNVYLNNHSRLEVTNTSINRIWSERNTIVSALFLLPPYWIRGKADTTNYVYYYDKCAIENYPGTNLSGEFTIRDTTTEVNTGAIQIIKDTSITLPIGCKELLCQMATSTDTKIFSIPIYGSLKESTAVQARTICVGEGLELKANFQKVTTTGISWSSQMVMTITAIMENGTDRGYNIYAKGIS